MENKMQIFNHDQFGEIRSIWIEGEPWLVGKDVAAALGYQNASKALSDHVDEEDKLNNESLSSLGQRGGWLINESGLYALIFGSKLPEAKAFKHWVTSEVLPTIRKTGAYGVPTPAISPETALSLINSFSAAKSQQERLFIVGTARTFGVDRRTMDLLEAQLLEETGQTAALPAPKTLSVIVPENYQKLLRRIAEIGEKDNSGPVSYIKIKKNVLKREERKIKVNHLSFLSWLGYNGFFDYDESAGHKNMNISRERGGIESFFLIADRVKEAV